MRASAASASARVELAARRRRRRDRSDRSSRARARRRARRARRRSTTTSSPASAHTCAIPLPMTPAPSTPIFTRRHGSSGRSMRASQSPGATSSACGRHHRLVGPEPVELVERAVAALDHAAAERDARRRSGSRSSSRPSSRSTNAGRVAALEPVPAQRFVEPAVRRHHALAERLDDDVGVALEHRHEALQLFEQRLLALGAHRAEQHVGIGERCASASIDDGSDGSKPPSWLSDRVGLHLVRADVRRTRSRTSRSRTHGTERCAPCTTSRSASA